MTGNANFAAPNPVPNPTLAVITADVNALETSQIAAEGGGKDETALMYAKEDVLDRDLTNLGAYVQMVANNNSALAEAIVISAGMDVKTSASHLPQEFSVVNTGVSGQLKLTSAVVKLASYIWQMCTDPGNESNWQTIKTTKQSKFIKDGLTSGTRYYFRVAVVDKAGQGGWSNVLNSLVL